MSTDVRALRQRFRSRLLSDAEAIMARRMGDLAPGVRIVDLVLPLGSRGAPLDGTEQTPAIRLGLNGTATILTWSLNSLIAGVPAAGSVTLDVLAGPSLATAASICGSNRPSLAAQVERNDQGPTSWSPTLLDPSTIMAVARAVDGVIEVATLTLRLAVGGAPASAFIVGDDSALITDDTGAPLEMER
jgi:hypothetical protein